MSRPRRIYIAGPMRGYAELNIPAFREAAHRFRCAGWLVVSPVEVGEAAFGDEQMPGGDYIRVDVRALLDCDAIAVLPGWELSTGARCEATVARTIGYSWYDAETMEEIAAPHEIVIRGGYERPVELPASLPAKAPLENSEAPR